MLIPDHPTPKFGEALRNQVEERLAFFDTGAAPSKNADAMRKVLESLDLEDDEAGSEDEMDADPPLPLIEPSPKKDKKSKDKKKRKSEAMDVDDDDEEDDQP